MLVGQPPKYLVPNLALAVITQVKVITVAGKTIAPGSRQHAQSKRKNNSMKKVWIMAAALLVAGLASSAMAADKAAKAEKRQGAFAKYDKNGNGTLDADEKEAVKSAFGSDKALKKLDTNGDGKLDDSEISAMKAPKKAGKKKNQ